MLAYAAVALATFAAACVVAAMAIRTEHISELMRRAGTLRGAAILAVQNRHHAALPRSAQSDVERQGRYVIAVGAGAAVFLCGLALRWAVVATIVLACVGAAAASGLLLMAWQARQRRLSSRLNIQATWLVSQLPAIVAAVGDNEHDILLGAQEDSEHELSRAIAEVLADIKVKVSLVEALGPWRRSSVHALAELANALPQLLGQPTATQRASIRELESRVMHDLEIQVHREVDRNASWIHLLFGISVVAFVGALIVIPTVQSISSSLMLH